jgi:endonuclease G
MTNHHVIPSPDAASRAKVEFDYQLPMENDTRPRTAVRYALDPASTFHTSPEGELDFTVVAIARHAGKPDVLSWGPLRLAPDADPVAGEPIQIVQHPNAQLKQIALTGNSVVVEVVPPFVRYHTDTMPGSSGAPIFNDRWQVVAIHHKGGPANQGILMSAIKAHLGSRWPSDAAR